MYWLTLDCRVSFFLHKFSGEVSRQGDCEEVRSPRSPPDTATLWGAAASARVWAHFPSTAEECHWLAWREKTSPLGIKKKKGGGGWGRCIQSMALCYYQVMTAKHWGWSLLYTSVYSEKCIKMRFGSGGGSCSTSSGLWGALRLFPSLFRQDRFWTFFFPLHIFHLPFVLWLYHSSLFLSLLLLLMRSLITASPLYPPSPRPLSLPLSLSLLKSPPPHSPFFSPTRISLLVDTHFLSFTPFPHFSLPQSRCQSDTFFSWLYNVYWPPPPPPPPPP